MRLHPQLSLLVAVAIAPVLVIAVAAGVLLVRHERQTMKEEAIGRTQSAMSAVEADIRGHFATLQALVASKSLEDGDTAAFYQETQRVLRGRSHWLTVRLALATETPLFDALVPLGNEMSPVRDLTSFRLAVATRQPVISDVDTSVQPPIVRLRMPVMVDGVVRYVVTVVMTPDAFDGVLLAQRVPENWVIALVDRNRRFIARIPALPAGTLASETFRSAINRSPSGWFAGQTLEGTRTYTPYVTSEPSGWVLGIAIPASTVDAAANRTLIGMGGGIAAALGIALLLGWYMAWRIGKPVAALAEATEAMAQGNDVRISNPSGIDEIARLSDALRGAAAAVRERSDLQEREKAALQASDRAKDEFLAMLSHELRNPLAALTAAAHVVKLAQPGSEAAIKATRGDRAPDQAHGAAGGRPARHQPRGDGQGGDRARALQPREGGGRRGQRLARLRPARAPFRQPGREGGVGRCRPRAHRAGVLQPAGQRAQVHPAGPAHQRQRRA